MNSFFLTFSSCPLFLSQVFSDMLRENKSLRSLNLESNFITGVGVQALVEALRDNDTLTEIKIDNQVIKAAVSLSQTLKFYSSDFQLVVRTPNLAHGIVQSVL